VPVCARDPALGTLHWGAAEGQGYETYVIEHHCVHFHGSHQRRVEGRLRRRVAEAGGPLAGQLLPVTAAAGFAEAAGIAPAPVQWHTDTGFAACQPLD